MLNVGCGHRFHQEWVNIDLVAASEEVIAHNILKGLPFPDASFDVVYHSHILEHLTQQQGRHLLRECYRVLKPDGIIRVVVPDLAYSCRLYLQALDEVLAQPDQQITQEHYQWAVLNLVDQMVRTMSGGEMQPFLKSDLLDPEYVVQSAGGTEIRHMLAAPVARNRTASLASRLSGLTPHKIWSRIIRPLFDKILTSAQKETRFRNSGEIHKWMYDRYSLGRLLQDTAFSDPQFLGPNESMISGWSDFQLDVDASGNIHKPKSLFAEAVKRK
ncbi:MAG: hypothetical protein OHK0046_23910 [Anaerolineae bacterium]